MKYCLIIVLLTFGSFSGKHSNFKKIPSSPIQVQQSRILNIGGYPGEIIDKCIDKRIMGQDVDHLIEPIHAQKRNLLLAK